MKSFRILLILAVLLPLRPAFSDSAPASLARPVEGNLRLSDAELVDQHGQKQRFSDSILNAQLSVINFSFTSCRTVCPLSNLVMQQLEELLNDGPIEFRPKLVTLTIDPFQDSPQVMKEMAEQLGAGPQWAWYSGDPANVFAVLDGLNYQFGDLANHPQRYLIIDAQRSRYLLLPDDVTAEQLLTFSSALAKP